MFNKMIEKIKFDLAKSNKKVTIVFAEGWNPSIINVAKLLKSEGIINPKLLFKNKKQVPNDISNIDYFIIENNNLDKYANFLFDLRKEKGLQIEEAKEMVKEPNYLATLMVKMNEADCEICGIEYPTMDTYKPALQIIKTNPVLSPIACSIMILNKKNKKYIFADISLNLDPNANELSSIAKLTALFANNVLNFKNNKIAMLSYSSEGSGKGISVDKVKTAAKILKSDIDMKKFNISNDIQFDAAFCPEINKKKIPYLKWNESAGIYIFPNLDSANIGYKIAQRMGNYEAIGPICIGLSKPVNDLSRGASEQEILQLSYITAKQFLWK